MVTLIGNFFRSGVAIIEGAGIAYDNGEPYSGNASYCRIPPTMFSSDTLVPCLMPAASHPGVWLRVRADSGLEWYGALYSDPVFVAFDAPTITGIVPETMPLEGGILTVLGSSLGVVGHVVLLGISDDGGALDDQPADDHSVRGVRCAPVLSWSHTKASCVVLGPARSPAGTIMIDTPWASSDVFRRAELSYVSSGETWAPARVPASGLLLRAPPGFYIDSHGLYQYDVKSAAMRLSPQWLLALLTCVHAIAVWIRR